MLNILTSEAALLALIAAVGSIVTLVIKHFLDGQGRRLDAAELKLDAADQRLGTLTTVMADVIQWAYDLESHITEQKPPPPPRRPNSLIQFFTLHASKDDEQ